jgi:DNA-binding Lrp family transcriptional regulator
MRPLDDVDQKIVRLLREDGRMSNAKLAAAVGLSPSACLRRLHLLEHDRVIRGYTAIVEAPDPGPTTTVMVEIVLEKQTADVMNRFEAAVRRSPDVRECYLMSGTSDYYLRVEAKDAADYERIHREQLARLPGVRRITSSFTLRCVTRADPRGL